MPKMYRCPAHDSYFIPEQEPCWRCVNGLINGLINDDWHLWPSVWQRIQAWEPVESPPIRNPENPFLNR